MSLITCSEKHDEIVFDDSRVVWGRTQSYCPACALAEEVEKLQLELEAFRSRVGEPIPDVNFWNPR